MAYGACRENAPIIALGGETAWPETWADQWCMQHRNDLSRNL